MLAVHNGILLHCAWIRWHDHAILFPAPSGTGKSTQARDAGMVFVLLTGGEPFLRRDFFEIYHEMKQMGLLLSINSNGSMIRGEILRKLIEDPPFRINISLYGGSNDTYCRMCGKPIYDQVVENIRALREAGIDVRLNLSITPYNLQDMELICRKGLELGVHMKATAYMYPSIRVNGGQYGCGNRLSAAETARINVKWDLLRFSPEEFEKRAKLIRQLVKVDASECSLELEDGVRCRAGSSAFWGTWDGKNASVR